MERITRNDVDKMAARLLRSMVRCEIVEPGARLRITSGSSTMGNSWRVEYETDERGSRNILSDARFGFTVRECYDRLQAMAVALEAVPAFVKPETPATRRRVVEDIGNPGRWVQQAFYSDSRTWYDIGDSHPTYEAARAAMHFTAGPGDILEGR